MKVLKMIWTAVQFIIAMAVIAALFYATVVVGTVDPTIFFLMP